MIDASIFVQPTNLRIQPELNLGSKRSVQHQILTGLSEAKTILSEWNALVDDCPSASVYDTPEYVLTAWKHYGREDQELLLFTFRSGGKLVGLIPLYRRVEKVYGIACKGLSHVSDFEGDCPRIVGYDRPALWTKLYQVLATDYTDWDLLSLVEQELSDHDLIRGFQHDGNYFFFDFVESNRFLSDTGTDYVEYFAKLSKSSRTEIKRKIKKNEARDRPFQLQSLCQVEDQTLLMDYLDRYVKIEDKTWKVDDGVGINNKPHSLAFHREFLGRLAKRKAVSFWFLTDDGTDIASLVAYHFHDTLYMAHTTFDPAYATSSPGVLATKGLLEYACRHSGIRRYDPLATPTDQGKPRHKTVWATHRDPIATRKVLVFRKTGLIGVIGWAKQSRAAMLLKQLRIAVRQRRA